MNLTPRCVVVHVSDPLAAEQGQSFHVEVFGSGAIAVFEAHLEMVSGSNAAFHLTSPIRTLPSHEEMRVRAKDVVVRLFHAHEAVESMGIPDLDLLASEAPTTPRAEGQIVDLSMNGIGIVVDRPLERGVKVRFEIESLHCRAEGTGEVRYCKAQQEGFRIGISIAAMDRLNRGHYERIVSRSAAA